MRLLLIGLLSVLPLAGQGANLIVGDIPDCTSYGATNNESAFSLAVTACNVGSAPLLWTGLPQTDHPVLAQNLYRIDDGRFTQIGMSWLKHGVVTSEGSSCGACTPTPGDPSLGAGCSDAVSAADNGLQAELGPRSDVDPVAGTFPIPNPPPVTSPLDRRLRAQNADVSPFQNWGATYLVEAHFLARDDRQAGNGLDNAAWREADFSSDGSGGYTMALHGATLQAMTALEAWPLYDPSVQIAWVDVPNDGRLIVAYRTEQRSSGRWRHFFAVHNYDSHRAVESLTLNFPSGSTFSNIWHHKVDHHSGEPFTNAAWTETTTGSAITWTNDAPHAVDPNANAIRWGTCYSFEVETEFAPLSVSLGLFRPGTPASVAVTGLSFASPPAWQTNSPEAWLDFDGLSNAADAGPIKAEVTYGSLVTAHLSSTVTGAPFDLATTPGPPLPAVLWTPNGQRINMNLATLSWLFGFFQLQMPPGGLSIPFITPPSFPIGFGCQMVVVDAASPDGVHYSAAVDFTSRSCIGASETLSLGDDDLIAVPLGTGETHGCIGGIPFGGTVYGSLRVHANGSITFGGNPTGMPPTTVQDLLQGVPRIAAMWTDLDPSSDGTVTVTSTFAGALTVRWEDVSTAGSSWSNPTASTVAVAFDTASSSFSISSYAPDPSHALPTLVGVKTATGYATGTGVNFASLAYAGPQTGTAGTAIYQMESASAPTGFSLILFPNSDESLFTVY